MRIIQVTPTEIIIDGIVPIDEVPPLKKSGKPDDPNPIKRLCHKAKKELLKDPGVCIAYDVSPQIDNDEQITKVTFFFSNTGKITIPPIDDEERLSREMDKYCQMMSARCAELIEAYLLDLEFGNH